MLIEPLQHLEGIPQNAFVMCVIRGGTPGESCLHYDVVDHLSNHAMKMLQTRVQLRSDTELIVFMGVVVQHGMPRSSWAGTVPRPWPWQPQGGQSWQGSLRLPTGTPSGRLGAAPA